MQGIIKSINEVLQIKLSADPGLCILNIMEESSFSKNIYDTIVRSLFQASKLIAQKWISIYPPTVEEWRTQIKETILNYTKREIYFST